MSRAQPDLFDTPTPTDSRYDDAYQETVRVRLHGLLALVRGAPSVPWPSLLGAIHADNAFRNAQKQLPPGEWKPLWAEFDAEMDRLYAVLNEGKEMPDD